jgi:hypothetical protein
MNTFEKINAAINALQSGNELKNASTWKTVQAASGPVLIILTALVNVIDIPLTGGQLTAISFAVASIGVLINTYLTVATTKTLGVKT